MQGVEEAVGAGKMDGNGTVAEDTLHIWQGLREPEDAARWVEAHLEASRGAVAKLLGFRRADGGKHADAL